VVSASTGRIWLGWVVFFFAWGFVIHGAGLVLHEVGGHGVAATILGCGISRINLTYFGHGNVPLAPCTRWTWTSIVIIDWAGLAVTISAGAVAMVLQRRAGLAPLTRLLVALLATAFLLGQLAYATSGGFHDLYDPGGTARVLGARGLHVVAWLPPLVLFAGSALFGARAIVDAFREHFASRSRLDTLKQIAATLGAAGLLYFVAFYLERRIRIDIAMRGVSFEAERLAAVRGTAAPFQIERVLFAIAVGAFIIALARPVVRGDDGQDAAPRIIPRRYAVCVAGAALMCAVTITLLVRV
jgi:hypothetical protein